MQTEPKGQVERTIGEQRGRHGGHTSHTGCITGAIGTVSTGAVGTADGTAAGNRQPGQRQRIARPRKC